MCPRVRKLRAEAILLMRVQDQLISPRYGGPIIGALRRLCNWFILTTKDGTTLTPEFSNLAMLGGYTDELPKPATKRKRWCQYILENNYSHYSFQKISTMSLHQNGPKVQKVHKRCCDQKW